MKRLLLALFIVAAYCNGALGSEGLGVTGGMNNEAIELRLPGTLVAAPIIFRNLKKSIEDGNPTWAVWGLLGGVAAYYLGNKLWDAFGRQA